MNEKNANITYDSIFPCDVDYDKLENINVSLEDILKAETDCNTSLQLFSELRENSKTILEFSTLIKEEADKIGDIEDLEEAIKDIEEANETIEFANQNLININKDITAFKIIKENLKKSKQN